MRNISRAMAAQAINHLPIVFDTHMVERYAIRHHTLAFAGELEAGSSTGRMACFRSSVMGTREYLMQASPLLFVRQAHTPSRLQNGVLGLAGLLFHYA